MSVIDKFFKREERRLNDQLLSDPRVVAQVIWCQQIRNQQGKKHPTLDQPISGSSITWRQWYTYLDNIFRRGR